jgi:hypothetical protein
MILEHGFREQVLPCVIKTAENQGGLGGLSGWADSNRRPPRPKRGALPAALHPGLSEYNA